MRTLLTGFDPFGALRFNPSQLIVEEIARRTQCPEDILIEVLPTEFIAGGNRIVQLIQKYRPQRVICLGVGSPGPVRFERVALNLDDNEVPDNTGVMHKGKKIVLDGPLAYWSTLPMEEMQAHLNKKQLPALVSNYAGTFLCNHVFYLARHEVELQGLGAECGFIHVPPLASLIETREDETPLGKLVEAIECCLAFRSNGKSHPV